MPYDFKKILAGVAALGALGFGGSAIAGAATDTTKAPTAVEQSAEQPGTEVNDAAEKGEANEPEVKISAADQRRAGDAALAKVDGKVTDVSAETPNANEPADTPEKGDTPDPAYENQVAFDVEVTKADGKVVDVSLDKFFSVLGTQAGEQDQAGEQNEQNEAAEVTPAR